MVCLAIPLRKNWMMRKVAVLLLVCAVCGLGNAHAQKKLKVMAVGFYNCENFFDTLHDPNKKDQETTPTPAEYRQKVHNIASVISALGTDVTPDGAAIVGLAEIENDNVLNDLIADPALQYRNYKYCWFYTPDERGISVAMLYNPKYLKVLKSEPLHVDLKSIGLTRPTRDVLHVVGILAGGDTVHFLVNHWPSKSGGEAITAPARVVAAKVDKRIIDSLSISAPHAKVVIMGDFNDNPTGDGFKEVLKVKLEPEELAPLDLYDPYLKMYKKGMGTESYQGNWNMIDQMMVSGSVVANANDKWKFYKSEIFKRDFMVYQMGNNKGLPHRSYTASHVWDNGFSDHFPVVTFLVKEN